MNNTNTITTYTRATPQSPSIDPEPDSTNADNVIDNIEDEVNFQIVEKESAINAPIDSLASIIRIEQDVDNVEHITYPVEQDSDVTEDSCIKSPTATIIQAPMSPAIVQNIGKLPQNFTFKVNTSVGNLASLQNVNQEVSGNQTLWLPTILTTNAPAVDCKKDVSQASLSQIIFTSDNFHDDHQSIRTNIIADPSYIRPKAAKVQILSNIALPKNATYSSQFIQNKDLSTPAFTNQNHIYKLNSNLITQNNVNSSVLCKPLMKHTLVDCSNPTSISNNSPIKMSYSQLSKSTNFVNSNKANNSTDNSHGNVLSRVVSGPNKAQTRKTSANLRTKGAGQNANTKRSFKIIRKTGAGKSDDKNWSVPTSKQHIFGVANSNSSKIIKKVGTAADKQQTVVQKLSKGDRLVVHSPCGPVLLTTDPMNVNVPKGPQYVQSGSTPNLRYVHTYSAAESKVSAASQATANQQLTAQILQSLSQPKLMFHSNPATNNLVATDFNKTAEEKPIHQKRIVL